HVAASLRPSRFATVACRASPTVRILFLFHPASTTEIYSLSLHDALPICHTGSCGWNVSNGELVWSEETYRIVGLAPATNSVSFLDRKSTRLNSSHVSISYAVFCLKKKKQNVE